MIGQCISFYRGRPLTMESWNSREISRRKAEAEKEDCKKKKGGYMEPELLAQLYEAYKDGQSPEGAAISAD